MYSHCSATMSAKILQTFGGGVWWRSSVLYYLFVGFGGILDGFQSMSLVFELITELSQFGGSVTSLLIDPFAAFITHLLSCVKILTLRRKKIKIKKNSATDAWRGKYVWQGFLWRRLWFLPLLSHQLCAVTDCAAHHAWSGCHRDQKPGRKDSNAPSLFQTPRGHTAAISHFTNPWHTLKNDGGTPGGYGPNEHFQTFHYDEARAVPLT